MVSKTLWGERDAVGREKCTHLEGYKARNVYTIEASLVWDQKIGML